MTHRQRLGKQISNGLTGGKPTRRLAESLRLDLAVRPAVENLDHRRAQLQSLGANRADGICGYVCA